MFRFALIAFILLEIALFIVFGRLMGVLGVLAWVVAGFFVGGFMIKRGGEKSRRWLEAAARNEEAGDIGSQIFYFIGGLLVILPGFFTDFIGIALILPPIRHLILRILGVAPLGAYRDRYEYVVARADPNYQARGEVIEGEIVDDKSDDRT